MRTLAANSRYFATRLIRDGSVVSYGTWTPPRYGPMRTVEHIVTAAELNRPDLVSFLHYGTSDLWWAILHFNGLSDGFGLIEGDRLAVPDRATMFSFMQAFRTLKRPDPEPSDMDYSQLVPITQAQRQGGRTLNQFLGRDEEVVSPLETDSGIFNFGFEIPAVSADTLHFQLQFSADADFASIVLNRYTATSRTNWFSYNPDIGAAGAFVNFPSDGVDPNALAGQTVYHSTSSDDPLNVGSQYYLRWRYFDQDGNEGAWVVPPPIHYGT